MRSTTAADLAGEVRRLAPEGAEFVHLQVPSDHPAADVIRGLEAEALPDTAAYLTPEVERCCQFLVLVDLRPGVERIVHCTRVSGPQFLGGEPPQEGHSGIVVVDELIDAGAITLDEVRGHYRSTGRDPETFIGVETNFRVGAREADHHGIRAADLGYLAIFAMLIRLGSQGVCAHINEASRRSFERIGFAFEPLCGRADLRSPGATEDEIAEDFRPTFLPGVPDVIPVLQRIALFTPPLVALPG